MGRSGAGVVLIVAGVVCGVAIAVLNHAFKPHCGEDCSAAFLASLLTWVGVCAVAFLLLGFWIWPRTRRTAKTLMVMTSILMMTAIVPFFSIYMYELHQRYWQSAWRNELPNADFSLMVIATEPVMVTEYGTTQGVPIKAWERCVLGVVSCDTKPHSVEAICLGSGKTLVIAEPAWPAFRRIEDEDLEGMPDKPGDMNLCAAQLQKR